ncbi:MAG: malonyl-CoA decarboxylase [Motiliproteus sp.]
MRINQLISSVADAGREILFNKNQKPVTQSLHDLCADLCSNKGEALGTALAREVVVAYNNANKQQKIDFFFHLLTSYSANPSEVLKAAEAYKSNADYASFKALNDIVEAPRQNLFRRINMAPGGIKTIVQLRQDLLAAIKEHPELKVIDFDLKHLLNSWFNRGFLSLEEIDWKTPAHILEKLIKYEAVHAMNGWDDLKKRLGTNRRCFGFFHPSLPDEPLIFVEVALVKGIADKVQPLIDPDESIDEIDVDTAIFYSISNCQAGLQGISFGNFLIKQVVMELKKEQPSLSQYATLSPIPGFGKWLKRELDNTDSSILTPQQRDSLKALSKDNWHADETTTDALKIQLMPLCAHYLYKAKRRSRPLDPVANFHLGNGAYIQRINWLGDTSDNGIKQSMGMLVNYRYEIDKVEKNHECFVNEGKITVSNDFKKMLP